MRGATIKTTPKDRRFQLSTVRSLLLGLKFQGSGARLQAAPNQHELGRISDGGPRIATAIPAAARFAGLAAWCLLFVLGVRTWAVQGEFSARFLATYQSAQRSYQAQPHNPTNGWDFAHACFDLADYATNNAERAAIAQQGIAAARQAIAENTSAATGHQNLGLNLGQLARTKTLGALRLVVQMEREFTIASQLDPKLDYAGPDRCLGLLYRDAPSFGSIGNRTKARQHLLRALELAPQYPENGLNLVESQIKWNERNAARRQLATLEAGWSGAQTNFAGPAWAANWADWTPRLQAAQKTLGEPPKPLQAPRH